MSQSLDAGLAKRLAEAADCFRDGKYHYFICKKTPPYELNYTKGFDSDEEASSEADAAKTALGSGYEKFFQPYYVSLYGIEVAKELRAQAVNALTASPMRATGHLTGRDSAIPATSKSKPGGTLYIAGDYSY